MQLYPHQAEALENIRNGSVLCGGVGSGKTHASLAYYVREVCGGSFLDRLTPMATPKNLIVITTAKKRDKRDWQNTALEFGIFDEPELSYGGVGIIVDSWNNIGKYTDVEDAFFIFDEQRVVGSGKWAKHFLKIAKQNQWVLLSATPADTWIEYVPLFIAHGFFRNRTEFLDNHVVWTFHGRYRKIRGYYGRRVLEAYRDAILVEMPYEKHTTRHLELVKVSHDEALFAVVWKKRWNPYDDVPLVDVSEMHRLGRKVVNSDLSRIDAIKKLFNDGSKRLIVFYNFDYELEILRTLHTELDVVVAEWNGHRHEELPETKEWIYLVQYQAGAEGWNCTTTDAIVFYSLTYSHKLFEQSQGRIDRLDTPYDDLWYYILMSDALIEKLIWKALQGKKNFHEGRNVKFQAAA